MDEILSVRDLVKNIGIIDDTARRYLGSYRFDKFRVVTKSSRNRRVLGYKCSKEFWEVFIDYLKIRQNKKILANVLNYLDSIK